MSAAHRASTVFTLLAVVMFMEPSYAGGNGSDGPAPEGTAPPWRMVLQQQIKTVKACDLNEVLTFSELQLGEDKVLEGRVSCIDGREFTFMRRREHQKFEFELCEPTVC